MKTWWWQGLEVSWFWHSAVPLSTDLLLGPDSTVCCGPDDRVFVDGREARLCGFGVFVGEYSCRLPCPRGCPLCARGQCSFPAGEGGGACTSYGNEFSGVLYTDYGWPEVG